MVEQEQMSGRVRGINRQVSPPSVEGLKTLVAKIHVEWSVFQFEVLQKQP